MSSTTITWGHAALWVEVEVADDGTTRVGWLGAEPPPAVPGHQPSGQPLVELVTATDGLTHTSPRYSGTPVGQRLRYRTHERTEAGGWHHLRIELQDPLTSLDVALRWSSPDGLSVVRSTVELTNAGPEPIALDAVSSFTLGVPGAVCPVDRLDVLQARSDWVGESRWRSEPARHWLVPDVDGPEHGHPRGRFPITSRGTWSTGTWLPMGALHDRATDRVWAWQIEHHGAWHWELGERRDGWYLCATGPTDAEHRWRRTLEPGASFETVPAALAVGVDGVDGVVATLTGYRRAVRREHAAMRDLPVVFNDYMNTLMGDPTTERLLPLIDAAASVGAEYFCIDAGWYDDGEDWWDGVGAWEPSPRRFPGGLAQVLDHVRDAGLVPGLWLEPEVVGVRSPIADELPDDAFFCRDGRRLVVGGRYHLDLRHPAARAHLDGVVDRLVTELGVGYFKLDYNIDPGHGTDVAAESLGDGALGHQRAHLAWLDGVLDRHPTLVLENCASGAMRMDPALLARLHLQSTTDQQNPLLYPPIAAAAPMLIPPEQAGNWAYPQPTMDAEAIAFTMCTGLAGRLYLSGHLDRLSADQLALVADGVTVARTIRDELARSVPVWPLGLPVWDGGWIAVGFVVDDISYVTVWHRGDAPDETVLALPHLHGSEVAVTTLYPSALPELATTWDADTAALRVSSPGGPSARVLRVVRSRETTSTTSHSDDPPDGRH